MCVSPPLKTLTSTDFGVSFIIARALGPSFVREHCCSVALRVTTAGDSGPFVLLFVLLFVLVCELVCDLLYDLVCDIVRLLVYDLVCDLVRLLVYDLMCEFGGEFGGELFDEKGVLSGGSVDDV